VAGRDDLAVVEREQRGVDDGVADLPARQRAAVRHLFEQGALDGVAGRQV
jgi:hypothetical protein